MSVAGVIQIGTHSEFLRVCEIAGYAVWSKTNPDRSVVWIIARRPGKVSPTDPQPPASVSAEFTSESAAVETLQRWAATPQPPKMLRSPDEPAGKKASLGFRKKRKAGPGQLTFKLF
jgi:hypothetical protein